MQILNINPSRSGSLAESEDDMEKVDRWKCLTCKYGYTENGYTVYCDYIGMTGKRRNCPYRMCDKYEDGKQKRRWTLK